LIATSLSCWFFPDLTFHSHCCRAIGFRSIELITQLLPDAFGDISLDGVGWQSLGFDSGLGGKSLTDRMTSSGQGMAPNSTLDGGIQLY
jgi:hypothetical protein